MSEQEVIVDKVEPCTEQPCPYMGYTDTKKCWFHSRGLPSPPLKAGVILGSIGSMTFEEACQGEDMKRLQEQANEEWQ